MKQPLFVRPSWLLLGGMWLAAGAQAADPAGSPASPMLVPSEDGASIIDLRARQPPAHAVGLPAGIGQGHGLRMVQPRVPELKRLVDKTISPAGLDPALFPAAPHDWHWSGTANVSTGSGNQYNYGNVMNSRSGGGDMAFRQGWAVNLETAESRGDVGKGTRLLVRLVRPHVPAPEPVGAER